MVTIFRMIFGICLLGSASYFLLLKDNNFSYKFDNFEVNRESIAAVASTSLSIAKAKSTQVFSDISIKTQEFAKDMASSVVDTAKNYAFEIVKKTAEESLNKLGEKAGIDVNSLESLPENSVMYSVKKGENAYFTIKNSEDGLLKYSVNWLDGKIDSGQLNNKDEFVVLVHSWKTPGEYLINFKIEGMVGEKIYKVLISVLN